MRILVVGAGATGGLFGGRLAKAGRDVTFLVRPARAHRLRSDGLQIRSPLGDFTIHPQIVETETIESHFDAILLGLKAHALQTAIEHFAPAVGPQTMIVPMLNGMRHIDILIDRFGEGPVLGGVCVVASMLDGHGRIVQLNEMQSLSYGELDGEITPRIRALDDAMQGAGFTARASSRILQEMWDKWVFLAALGAITCLLRGTIGTIEAAGGADLAVRMLTECASVARAAGQEPSADMLADARARLTQAGSSLASSMYRDLQQGHRVEADHILGDMIERARGFNLSTPLLSAAHVALTVYQRTLEQPA
jgi:2-dehydropantoate 2-reductase